LEKLSPKIDGKTYKLPIPSLCFECRLQRKLAFRNEYTFYKRKCNASWENIISIYSPNKDYVIYKYDFWLSDKWNPLEYGMEYNEKKDFFEQLDILLHKVPRINLIINHTMENSTYANYGWFSKNVYLSVWSFHSENILYSHYSIDCSWDVDGFLNIKWEHTYNCINTVNCYKTYYSINCENCNNSYFLYDCQNCENCFCCKNLKNKKYYYKNKPYSKDEYEKKIKKHLKNLNKFFDYFVNEFLPAKPYRNLYITNSENSIWNFILNSKNCYNCYDINGVENCANIVSAGYNIKDCMDCFSMGQNVEKVYESISITNSNNIWFSNYIINSSNLLYCDFCTNCHNCIWCVWLKNKEYCILNKQYSPKEYYKLAEKILNHLVETKQWGEFLPPNLSPFGYNETVAQDYFSLSKSTAKRLNFKWEEYQAPSPKAEKILTKDDLEKIDISKIDQNILNYAIECEKSKLLFKLTKQELNFYKLHNLPIPTKHPKIRYLERFHLKGKKKLVKTHCAKCKKEIYTTENLKDSIVYCEKCFSLLE